MPQGAPNNRLGFAKWLVDPKHPLTARVAVNRYWQMLFGKGLVASVEDFGTQGDRPTHPELLDALAIEFVESGWDVKAMLRLIVTSAAYRQSSKTDPATLERDPQKPLARAPGLGFDWTQNRYAIRHWPSVACSMKKWAGQAFILTNLKDCGWS